jgi:outer membrane protein assembly factor BamB
MKLQTSLSSSLLGVLIGIGVFPGGTDLRAADWPQWRGPQRNGISQEKGLLQEWPQEGPKLVWQVQDSGSGYSTPSVVGDRLYLLGNQGIENEFVLVLSAKDGQRVWSTRLGKVGNPDQNPKMPAARSTPTIESGMVYALGSDGDLACLDANSGDIRWHKSLRADFGGKPGNWAYAESPLIDGDHLICTPGGSSATVIVLNKKTGDVIWKCAVPSGDEAAYSSAIVVDAAGVKQYVQMLNKGLVGIDANSGKFLWRYNRTVSKYGANIPTPVARGDRVYSAGAGTGGGLIQLKAKDDSVAVEQIAFSPKLPSAIGGAILLGDYLYGTSDSMVCLDFNTGDVKWQERALGAASLCFADGRLYLHGENGRVALVEPSPEGYREKGLFSPPNQPAHSQEMEKAWAYPVVANGHLYIRDHNSLWCFDVAKPAGDR